MTAFHSGNHHLYRIRALGLLLAEVWHLSLTSAPFVFMPWCLDLPAPLSSMGLGHALTFLPLPLSLLSSWFLCFTDSLLFQAPLGSWEVSLFSSKDQFTYLYNVYKNTYLARLF